ncbi:MAG: HAMP domain-containing histidine kinase [Elusimicrobia bacterium]|jgi:signal transduction histidine kinase|nr:HAMP domain-containing histidine kinase [Elusimicrobiota bacterium]
MGNLSVSRRLLGIELTGYGLVFLPFLTDYIEHGRWPKTPIQLVTEGAVGLLILFYVRVIGQARSRLNRLEEERKDLTALLLHDMKTPLTVVMGTLTYLNEHPDDPERGKWIRAALRSCREDVELMTQLMEADRLEGKQIFVEKRTVHMPELLRSCAEEISASAARKKIPLNVSHTPEVGMVSADEGLLKRVMMNLLRNALKATEAGGRLDVQATTAGERLVVTVHDTGYGIPPDQMGGLFERYFRVRRKSAVPPPGWGLGLYFCKLAIEAHGGRINIQSQPGEGTLVRFDIPLERPRSGPPSEPEMATMVS